MEWIATLLPKPIRLPLAIVALCGIVITGALQGFWVLEAKAAETAEITVKAVVNSEVTQQLRTEAKNVAVEAAKEAAREAVKDAARANQADQEYILKRQIQMEQRIRELEEKIVKKK